MKRCRHESCGRAERIWLPYDVRGGQAGLKPHPYCIHCGVVKNISSDRARPLGYYINELTKLPLTKVQIRLILKELEAMGFDDTYSMTGTAQDEVFRRVVKKYHR